MLGFISGVWFSLMYFLYMVWGMDQSSLSSACRHLIVPASFVGKEFPLSLPSCPFVWVYFHSTDLFIFISEPRCLRYCSQSVLVQVLSVLQCGCCSGVASYFFISSACPFQFFSQLVSFFIKTPKDLWMILYWIYRSI